MREVNAKKCCLKLRNYEARRTKENCEKKYAALGGVVS